MTGKKKRSPNATQNDKKYPPDDLPAITRADFEKIVLRKVPAAGDPERLITELRRAERKVGYFRNSDRADSEDRQASATGTFTAVLPHLSEWADTGATVKRGRKTGGDKTARGKRKQGEQTTGKVMEAYRQLRASGKPERNIASIIHAKIGVSTKHIRTILKALRKPATS